MQPRELLTVVTGNAYRVDIESERHRWVLDEGLEKGGTDAGPTPVEAALAALVSCLTISFQFAARRKGVPIERIEGWVASNPEMFVEDVALELQVWSPAGESTVRELLPRAERGCFVKALLRPDLKLSISLAVHPATAVQAPVPVAS